MRWIASAAALLLTGCLTAGHLTESEPVSVSYSNKTVEELAGCVALKLADAKGYETRRSYTATGQEIALNFRISGVLATAGLIRIEREGAQVKMTTFATGKGNGAPKVIMGQVKSCA